MVFYHDANLLIPFGCKRIVQEQSYLLLRTRLVMFVLLSICRMLHL